MADLRFGTFNLLHGLAVAAGEVREGDLRQGIASLSADVLAMQEVDRGQPRSHKADQAAVAADALDARWWRFAPTLTGTPGLDTASPANPLSDPTGPAYGVALVSRLPVLSWHARSFPAAPLRLPLQVAGQRGLTLVPDQPRVVLAAVLIGPDGPFTVAAAHLSFVPGWNVRQLRATIRWLATMPPPRLLLGDLNLPGSLPRMISHWAQLARVATYPSWRPRVQWDHVLAQGVDRGAVRTVTVRRLGISDHAALSVDVTF